MDRREVRGCEGHAGAGGCRRPQRQLPDLCRGDWHAAEAALQQAQGGEREGRAVQAHAQQQHVLHEALVDVLLRGLSYSAAAQAVVRAHRAFNVVKGEADERLLRRGKRASDARGASEVSGAMHATHATTPAGAQRAPRTGQPNSTGRDNGGRGELTCTVRHGSVADEAQAMRAECELDVGHGTPRASARHVGAQPAARVAITRLRAAAVRAARVAVPRAALVAVPRAALANTLGSARTGDFLLFS